ncbi:MAG: amidase [Chloroflexota bacterium]|nr:amidase [Chloroflexota bacterium]
MTELHDLTAAEAATRIARRDVSPVELVDALLARIERFEPIVRAWVTVDAEGARAAARHAETEATRPSAALGPLHGVPCGIKDIYNVRGLPTTAGFPPLADNVPDEDAPSIARLWAAGAIVLGKTVTTQFASADPSPTRNPWRPDRTPGGSSSGSGAAVAARCVPFALGTQTGGSILRPAAYNGVVGLKPTYGRVSRRGVYPLAWSLDHCGPIARTVEDVALVLGAIAGHDPGDPRSLDTPVPDYRAALSTDRPPTLGLLPQFLERAEPNVRAHVEERARDFTSAGADVRTVELPSPVDLYLAIQNLTQTSEAAAVHTPWLARDPDAYAPRIRGTAMVGQLVPTPAYLHAQRLRRRLAAETHASLVGLDALLLPSVSNVAPDPATTGDPSFQAPWSLLGLPSITLPSGLSDDGLPFGVQLVAAHLAEPTLLRAASWCERTLAFDARPPGF